MKLGESRGWQLNKTIIPFNFLGYRMRHIKWSSYESGLSLTWVWVNFESPFWAFLSKVKFTVCKCNILLMVLIKPYQWQLKEKNQDFTTMWKIECIYTKRCNLCIKDNIISLYIVICKPQYCNVHSIVLQTLEKAHSYVQYYNTIIN